MDINNNRRVIEDAVAVLQNEADALQKLARRVDDRFVKMVEWIFRASGRVVVSGIGKPGLIGRKIVATLNSTGTRSFFLHPVEALHGDLGMVGPEDVFLALSYSGETDELNMLIPSIREIGCRVIAFTGSEDSTLAGRSHLVIDVKIDREACPLGLAPTTSSTAMLAMGDALAVSLINKRHFKRHDFRRYHPGGALGQRLARRVEDIMLTGDAVPIVAAGVLMKTALAVINDKRLGAALVCDDKGRLKGIVTDGDIRRCITRESDIWRLAVEVVMTPEPKRTHPAASAHDALTLMERFEITVLPITRTNGLVCGILHLHDILGKGAFRFEARNGGGWT